MSRKFERRLLDTNALVMGGGVGLAALESMFNLVNTQSLLSAGMVRDHDLAYGLALESLAMSIGEILEPGVYGVCRSYQRPYQRPGAVNVDMPQATPPAAPVTPSASASADAGARRGALDLNDLTDDAGSESRTKTTLQTSSSGVPVEDMMKLMEEIIQLFSDISGSSGDHMGKVIDHFSQASKHQLMVT